MVKVLHSVHTRVEHSSEGGLNIMTTLRANHEEPYVEQDCVCLTCVVWHHDLLLVFPRYVKWLVIKVLHHDLEAVNLSDDVTDWFLVLTLESLILELYF